MAMSDGPVQCFFWRVVDALDYVVRTTAAIVFFFFITIGACKADNSVLDLNDAASGGVLQQMSSEGKGNKFFAEAWVVISSVAMGIAAMRA
jgi:hypothetical protein